MRIPPPSSRTPTSGLGRAWRLSAVLAAAALLLLPEVSLAIPEQAPNAEVASAVGPATSPAAISPGFIAISGMELRAAPQPAIAPEERMRLATPRAKPRQTPPPPSTPDEQAEHQEEQVAASLPAPAFKPLLATPAFTLAWPSRGEVTTYFGERGPTSPRGHAGLDIAAPVGTPIYAAEAGNVVNAHDSGDGYGILVVINHGSGRETWYAHLSRAHVSVGDRVERRELIGRMGSTGFSTGSHLHFELRVDGALQNPLKLLP